MIGVLTPKISNIDFNDETMSASAAMQQSGANGPRVLDMVQSHASKGFSAVKGRSAARPELSTSILKTISTVEPHQ